MHFQILGAIAEIETIATSSGIRELLRLRKRYGRGRWRKRKGVAQVRLSDGELFRAEIHWYEATGIGRKEFKIKRIL
jgi:DNA invertase Pin-like site-specific DNA recombinase